MFTWPATPYSVPWTPHWPPPRNASTKYSVNKSTPGQQLHLNSFSFDWAIFVVSVSVSVSVSVFATAAAALFIVCFWVFGFVQGFGFIREPCCVHLAGSEPRTGSPKRRTVSCRFLDFALAIAIVIYAKINVMFVHLLAVCLFIHPFRLLCVGFGRFANGWMRLHSANPPPASQDHLPASQPANQPGCKSKEPVGPLSVSVRPD